MIKKIKQFFHIHDWQDIGGEWIKEIPCPRCKEKFTLNFISPYGRNYVEGTSTNENDTHWDIVHRRSVHKCGFIISETSGKLLMENIPIPMWCYKCDLIKYIKQ